MHVRLIPATGFVYENRPDDASDAPRGNVWSNLPSPQALDYIHKAGSATLIVLVIVVLMVYGVTRPKRALRLLEGRAGGGG